MHFGPIGFRKAAIGSALALALSVPATFAEGAPASFSADMVMKQKGGQTANGKIYLSAPKYRMDMNSGGNQVIMIADANTKTAYMVMPEQKMYMEIKTDQGMMGQGRLPRAKPMDPANPCADDPTMTCKKVGNETVNGRSTEKWEFTPKSGRSETYTAWIDQKLHFPIKTADAEGGGMELTNIREGAQPADLFEVPAGYRKFSMGMRQQ